MKLGSSLLLRVKRLVCMAVSMHVRSTVVPSGGYEDWEPCGEMSSEVLR